MRRCRLLSTTKLSALAGLVGCVLASAPTVHAADLMPMPTKALAAPPFAPAVDGLNGKFVGLGGSMANRSVYGGFGALSFPLDGQVGAQLDGGLGALDGRGFAHAAGHVFWRNPSNALLGVYVSHTQWDEFGGVHASHIAGEGALYLGHFTLEGIAGVEFGNSVSNTTTTTSIIPPGGPGLPPGLTTTSTFTEGFDVRTRFFDQINLKYYFANDWNAYVGHRYLGGSNALALGTEYAAPLGHDIMGSLFVEGRVGENEFHGVWGGFKLYFGQHDKPLIARHRQDDPPIWGTDSLFSIVNNHTSSSSSSSSTFCGPDQQIDPQSGNCDFPSSD
jgi:hypothetical protein